MLKDLVVVFVNIERNASLGIQFKTACHFSAKGKNALFGLASLEILEASLGKNDGVGLGKHFGVEKCLNLANNMVHSVGILLKSPKRVNGEFGNFPDLNKSVVVLALGKDGKHVALGDENLHDSLKEEEKMSKVRDFCGFREICERGNQPGVNRAENGLRDDC